MVKDGHELRCRGHRVNATTPRGSSPVRGDAHKILIHVLLDFVHAYVFFTSLRACVLESFTLSTIHFTFFCCGPFFAKKGTCNVNISPPTHFLFTTRSKCHEICPLLHFFSKMSPGDINSGTHCISTFSSLPLLLESGPPSYAACSTNFNVAFVQIPWDQNPFPASAISSSRGVFS